MINVHSTNQAGWVLPQDLTRTVRNDNNDAFLHKYYKKKGTRNWSELGADKNLIQQDNQHSLV